MAALPLRLVGVLARAAAPAVLAALVACGASLALLAPTGVLAQDLQPVPPLKARVTDLTGTLAPAQVQALEGALADIEQRKGAQVAILMVPTTRPEAIEQYGIRVAEAWKLGRGREVAQRATGDPNAPAVDDGVLLLVAKDDRRMRIEVGYGLEGAIPDGIARRIIDESIAPRFRREDYFGGLQAAVQDLRMRIDGEDLPPPGRRGAATTDDSFGLLPALIFAFVAGTIVSAAAGRLIGAGLGGLGAGFIGGAAAGSLLLGVGAGVLVFFLVLMMAPSRGGGLRRAGRHTYRHGPIFFPGGGWGGGGGGGGFGGFGGGGGGFGGGGASGGW